MAIELYGYSATSICIEIWEMEMKDIFVYLVLFFHFFFVFWWAFVIFISIHIQTHTLIVDPNRLNCIAETYEKNLLFFQISVLRLFANINIITTIILCTRHVEKEICTASKVLHWMTVCKPIQNRFISFIYFTSSKKKSFFVRIAQLLIPKNVIFFCHFLPLSSFFIFHHLAALNDMAYSRKHIPNRYRTK